MPLCRQEATAKLLRDFLHIGSSARSKMLKNWGVIGGVAAAMAAGVYVLWGPITDRKKRKRGLVPGLLNLGNTCFMNSLLQGLAACPSFVKWLEDITNQNGGSIGSPEMNSRLSKTLVQLLKALSNNEPMEDDVLDAGCLLEALRLYRWHISSFEEQDAHELFHVLTSSLEEERDQQPRVAHLFDMETLEKSVESSEKALSCRSRGPLLPIPSLWRSQHPFHGRLTSYMACKRCERQSPVRYDSFDSLSLSIPAVQWGRSLTLDHCLQHFISSETIKEVECENCTKNQTGDSGNSQLPESQRTTFIKQLKLGKLPQCLCIHLQRLTWSAEGAPIKRQEHVQFSEYLSMDRYKHRSVALQKPGRANKPGYTITAGEAHGQTISNGVDPEYHNNNNTPIANGALSSSSSSAFVLSPGLCPELHLTYNCSSPEFLFRLTAVLVHHGDTHSGHFVTYRRGPVPFSAQWLWVSDDAVRKASLQEALSSSAYLLFYERVPSRPVPRSGE